MKNKYILAALLTAFTFTACDDKEEMPVPDIELAAESLEFEVISTSQSNGVIKVTGIIKNTGDDYRSSSGQQKIRLYKRAAGATDLETLGTLDFTDLDAGETLSISTEIDWYRGMEFPPGFGVRIEFDPDLYIDGNEENDDTNTQNNHLERPGQDIHELFDEANPI